MLYRNGRVFLRGEFKEVSLRTEGRAITEIGENLAENGDEVCDLQGRMLVPGFVEIHSHGCMGYDFSNAPVSGIHCMLKGYLKNGVTSVLATTMTNEYGTYRQAMKNIREVMENEEPCETRIYGINMEGPYLGEDKKGAHDPRYLLPLSEETFDELNGLSGDAIRLIDLDPRLEGSDEFIKKYSQSKRISLAHTGCSYDQAKKAIESGADHITHLFNAMNGLHHREPGLIGAAVDFDVFAEIICDGIHVNETVLRLMFKAIPEKMVVISDSMSAAGLPDGEYELGGQKVFVSDGRAALPDGTLAGSTTNIHDEIKNLVRFGIPLEQVLLSATQRPAASVGLDGQIGSFEVGKLADMVVLNDDLSISAVIKEGIKTN